MQVITVVRDLIIVTLPQNVGVVSCCMEQPSKSWKKKIVSLFFFFSNLI